MYGGKSNHRVSIFPLCAQDMMMQAIDHLEATCHILCCSFSSLRGSLPHLVIFPYHTRFIFAIYERVTSSLTHPFFNASFLCLNSFPPSPPPSIQFILVFPSPTVCATFLTPPYSLLILPYFFLF